MRKLTFAGRSLVVVTLVLAGLTMAVDVASAKPGGTWPCAWARGKASVSVCEQRYAAHRSGQPATTQRPRPKPAGDTAFAVVASVGLLVLVVGVATLMAGHSRRATMEPQP